MARHDPARHDAVRPRHGPCRRHGESQQRPEADVNIEFQSNAKRADEAMKLAFFFRDSNEKYATDYPAAVGSHMTNTDSTPFMDMVPSISLRENERGMHIGGGWDPHWHQATDRFATFSTTTFVWGLTRHRRRLGRLRNWWAPRSRSSRHHDRYRIVRVLRALLIAVAVLGIGASAFYWVRLQRSRADLVLRGGRPITLDESMPEAQALAARDGRIIAIGSTRRLSPHIRVVERGSSTSTATLRSRIHRRARAFRWAW